MNVPAGPHATAEDIDAAAAALARGELVAFPTETVYGLGANADDDEAVARIFSAKGRPRDHPLIVHVASEQAAAHYGLDEALDARARRLMAAFWPGPLTLIVPRHAQRGAVAAAGQRSIGLRMPGHPVALALLRAAAARGVQGIAGPSANRFGRVSPTTAAHVRDEFAEPVPGPGGRSGPLLVLEGGACQVGIESAIVDLSGARASLLRPGQLERRHIEQVLGEPLAEPDASSPRASGTLASHYAPRARVLLMDRDALAERLAKGPPPSRAAGRVGVYSRLAPGRQWLHRRMPDEAAAAAQELFAVLRWFDQQGASELWVERPPAQAHWEGVCDRLTRAAAEGGATPTPP